MIICPKSQWAIHAHMEFKWDGFSNFEVWPNMTYQLMEIFGKTPEYPLGPKYLMRNLILV